MNEAGALRIGFLFNHDMAHQVAHTAPIIRELLDADQALSVMVLTSTPEQEAMVRHLTPASDRIIFTALSPGRLASAIDRIAGKALPFRRLAVLRRNLHVFAGLDALVVPETTSTLLKSKLGLNKLKLIYLPHGAGDRSIGFRPEVKAADYVLLSGEKVGDRMLAAGLIEEGRYAVIGYPKFDAFATKREKLFANDKPVVLYNPHFDPHLSSWYDMGTRVLDFFASQDRYNLIFAPHVMLFKRKIHLSVEHRRIGFVKAVAARYRDASNILTDLGSARSSDMTYTAAADVYLGDASSQAYEFIAEPRPCIFLNSHGADWNGDPNYAHWHLGEVVEDISALPRALDSATKSPDVYRTVQQEAVRTTFDVSELPASRRAAHAILAFLGRDDIVSARH